MKELTPQIEFEIKGILSKSVNEHSSGHLYCTNAGINKICKLVGLDYSIMSKEKRKTFRNAIIDIYQSNYFATLTNFLKSY